MAIIGNSLLVSCRPPVETVSDSQRVETLGRLPRQHLTAPLPARRMAAGQLAERRHVRAASNMLQYAGPFSQHYFTSFWLDRPKNGMQMCRAAMNGRRSSPFRTFTDPAAGPRQACGQRAASFKHQSWCWVWTLRRLALSQSFSTAAALPLLPQLLS